MSSKCIILGDPVPWFSAPVVTGGKFDLHVSAGRWVILSFLGSLANPRAMTEVAELARESGSFGEDHLVVACVFTGPPDNIGGLAAISKNTLQLLADCDGAISRSFGAEETPRTVVLDPMLRAVANISWDVPQGHSETLRNVMRGLPAIDNSAGVPMFAPALMVPRVFGFDLCDFLVEFFGTQGGKDSGFQFDIDGKTATLSDWRLKRRGNVVLMAPEVRDLVRSKIVSRLLPRSNGTFSFARRVSTDVSSLATTAGSAAIFTGIVIISTPAPSIDVSRSRSISIKISRAVTWCFPNSVARPIGRRKAARWCSHAARCTR